jgi:hypothetical protein
MSDFARYPDQANVLSYANRLLRPNVMVNLSGIDPDVAAFAARSGATDTTRLSAYAQGIKALGLWSNHASWPQKSAQNAGTGSTVFMLGGVNAGNGTLVNSPAWGANGIAYVTASSQYMSIPNFLGSETITVFARITQASAAPTSIQCIISQWNAGLVQRSWDLRQSGDVAGDPYDILRSADGGVVNIESYRSALSLGSTTDRTLVAQWTAGGARGFWINKSSESLALASGVAQTSRLSSTSPITFAAQVNTATVVNACSLTGSIAAIITGTITDAQREAITDLINAL